MGSNPTPSAKAAFKYKQYYRMALPRNIWHVFISSLWERDTPMVCMLNHWTGRDNIGVQGPA